MSTWQNDGSLTKYTTAPSTRSLSVTSNLQAIANATNVNGPNYKIDMDVTTTMVVLFYESLNGSMAVLSRVAKRCSVYPCPYWQYNENATYNTYTPYVENPIYTGDPRSFSWIDNSPVLRNHCALLLNQTQPECHTPFASGDFHGSNFSVETSFRWQKDAYAGLLRTIYTPSVNSEDPHIYSLGKYR